MPRLIDQGVNLIKYSFKKYLLNLCTEKQEVTLTKKVPSQYKIWTNSPKRAKRSQCKQCQILWIGKTMQGLKVSEVWKLVPVPLLTWWSRRLSRGSRVLQEPTSRWGKSDSRNKGAGQDLEAKQKPEKLAPLKAHIAAALKLVAFRLRFRPLSAFITCHKRDDVTLSNSTEQQSWDDQFWPFALQALTFAQLCQGDGGE